jgi:Tfp pilus assembly protein PilW
VRRGDRGYSVGEMVVTSAVAGLLLAALGTVVVGLTQGARNLNTATGSSADVRIALEAMSRMLRVAYQPAGEPSAIVSAQADSVSFYALVDRTNGATPPPPVLVGYSWNGTCLNESRTAGRLLPAVSGSGSLYAWDATPAVTCLLRTTSGPVFGYSTTGALGSTGADPAPLTIPAAGLSLVDRQTVLSVAVRVAGPASSRAPVVAASTRVTLQNVVAEAGAW